MLETEPTEQRQDGKEGEPSRVNFSIPGRQFLTTVQTLTVLSGSSQFFPRGFLRKILKRSVEKAEKESTEQNPHQLLAKKWLAVCLAEFKNTSSQNGATGDLLYIVAAIHIARATNEELPKEFFDCLARIEALSEKTPELLALYEHLSPLMNAPSNGAPEESGSNLSFNLTPEEIDASCAEKLKYTASYLWNGPLRQKDLATMLLIQTALAKKEPRHPLHRINLARVHVFLGDAEAAQREVKTIDIFLAQGVVLLPLELKLLSAVREKLQSIDRNKALDIEKPYPNDYREITDEMLAGTAAEQIGLITVWIHGARQNRDAHAAARFQKRITELDPTNAKGWILYALTLERLGRFEEAIDILSKTVPKLEAMEDISRHLERIQMKLKERTVPKSKLKEPDYKKVTDEMLAATAKFNFGIIVHWSRGAYLNRDFEAVARFQRRLLELEPGNLQALGLLAASLEYSGRLEEALEVQEEILKLNPSIDPRHKERVVQKIALAKGGTAEKPLEPAPKTPKEIFGPAAKFLADLYGKVPTWEVNGDSKDGFYVIPAGEFRSLRDSMDRLHKALNKESAAKNFPSFWNCFERLLNEIRNSNGTVNIERVKDAFDGVAQYAQVGAAEIRVAAKAPARPDRYAVIAEPPVSVSAAAAAPPKTAPTASPAVGRRMAEVPPKREINIDSRSLSTFFSSLIREAADFPVDQSVGEHWVSIPDEDTRIMLERTLDLLNTKNRKFLKANGGVAKIVNTLMKHLKEGVLNRRQLEKFVVDEE